MLLKSLLFVLIINTITLPAATNRSHYNNSKFKPHLSDCQVNKKADEGYMYLNFDYPEPYSININFFHDRNTLFSELKEENNSSDELWVFQFLSDIKEHDAHKQLSCMVPIKNNASFSNVPPVLQTLAAVIILEG